MVLASLLFQARTVVNVILKHTESVERCFLGLSFQERQAKLDELMEEEKGILVRQGVSAASNGTHIPTVCSTFFCISFFCIG